MRLVNASDAWTIRAFEERGMEDLKTYLMNMPDRTQKQTLCVMPKLDYKPKDLLFCFVFSSFSSLCLECTLKF